MNYINFLYRAYRFMASSITSKDGSFKHIWQVAYPLIIMSATLTIMQICDRKFLSMQSTDYVAAALPAGMLAFNMGSFFLVTINFTSSVVAQYFGKKADKPCVTAAWSAIALALVAGIFISFCLPYVGIEILKFVASDEHLCGLQIEYFFPLSSSVAFACLTSACCSYFSGQGMTKVVAIANFFGMLVNILLDYLLIFGHKGFPMLDIGEIPALGLTGAGVATSCAALTTALVSLGFFFFYRPNKMLKVIEFIKFDIKMVYKIFKFGVPVGLMVVMDVGAWFIAMSLIGRISKEAAAAMTITVSINQLSFMPMLGFTDAASIIFGKNIGRGKLRLGEIVIYRSWVMIWSYMAITATIYLLFPMNLLNFFAPSIVDGDFSEVLVIGKISLTCAAFYNFFDSAKFILMGALRGAGDTKILVIVVVAACWLFMVPAILLTIMVFNGTIINVWMVFAALILIQTISFFIRFKSRKWANIKLTS
ncbi:MATE family efflux transporter [Lentisphaerota bacterium WC36G]|nr:MATE family efflux transporter [Lentisphaerae bacterium WC36]